MEAKRRKGNYAGHRAVFLFPPQKPSCFGQNTLTRPQQTGKRRNSPFKALASYTDSSSHPRGDIFFFPPCFWEPEIAIEGNKCPPLGQCYGPMIRCPSQEMLYSFSLGAATLVTSGAAPGGEDPVAASCWDLCPALWLNSSLSSVRFLVCSGLGDF